MHLDLTPLSATHALARRLATAAQAGDVITLAGDLGSGKTTLAGAFLAARGWTGPVPSPTFTLAQIYNTLTPPVWHLDCYRMVEAGEVLATGWEEARSGGILLIEWPDRIAPLLPPDRLEIILTETINDATTTRTATLTGHGQWHQRLLTLLP
jgi:tRNA threonylcarbamoyladenosine biosynthesis protein TsaE